MPIENPISRALPDVQDTNSVIAFMDMGTNSVRIMIVRINPNHSYTILSRQKEMVRLGANEFNDKILKVDAMERAVNVCRNFETMARSFKAERIIAVGTSATRDAKNRQEFIARLKQEAGIDLRVISGKEEARLIYLGVSSGTNIQGNSLFIDIGGGSTEIIVGNEKEHLFLDSLKLGAIRLTMLYLKNTEGPISPKRYKNLLNFVRNKSIRTLQHLKGFNIQKAFGSSGTIQSLAEVACQVIHNGTMEKKGVLRLKDLKQVIEILCSMPLKKRLTLPGLNPRRADIIIGGAVILDFILSELRIKEICISNRELRDGLLVNYLYRSEHPLMDELSVRQRSVLKLGRRCSFDEQHANNVARLSLSLFDSAYETGLHKQGQIKRELLYYAAQLHDIGTFISYTNHHSNSAHFIRNADLLGFNQDELAIMAATVLFHRKSFPGKKHPALKALEEKDRDIVRTQSVFLRLAESLDRSHGGLVGNARFQVKDPQTVILEITPAGDCQLELWGVLRHREVFKKIFGKNLIMQIKEPVALQSATS
ncbi:MAG: Ppx/GppA family phosphatase [Deltaproteobacteria bacterium]|nr:Ppx/GppA family phosphatase [Deltaproteobacteria bacterium]